MDCVGGSEAAANTDPTSALAGRSNLTRNQLLMWMGERLQPDSPQYNMTMTFDVAGEIDADHLARAFQAVIDDHDALRMVIDEIDGVPQQRIVERMPFKMTSSDFSSEADPQAALDRWLAGWSTRPYEFNQRLFDAALVKMAADRYVWCLGEHHIITDGWAMAMVYRRTAEYYERSVRGEHFTDQSPPSYEKYLERERAFRDSPERAAAEEFWQEKLPDQIEPIRFYGAAPLKTSTTVCRIQHDLGAQRTERLKQLARQRGIRGLTAEMTLFHVFNAALAAYLYRISGNRRLSIGVPFHNRPSHEAKDTIGLFMEVCPLQVEVSPDDTLLSLVGKIRAESNEILRHFRHGTGNPSQHKVYDVMLNYHNSWYCDLGGLPTRRTWIHPGHGNDSLCLQVHQFDDDANFRIEFDFHCDVFDGARQQQAIGHFTQILDGLIENAELPVEEIELLTSDERRRLLHEFNSTEAPLPAEEDDCRAVRIPSAEDAGRRRRGDGWRKAHLCPTQRPG